jgi:hypothetical protein
MEKYRIKDVQKARLMGRDCIFFKVYKLNTKKNAYVFDGNRTAPARTSQKNLINYI